nr:hypothetical protein [Mannheimia haemolytica]
MVFTIPLVMYMLNIGW